MQRRYRAKNAETCFNRLEIKTRKSTTGKGWDAEKKKAKRGLRPANGKSGNGKEPRDFHLVGTKSKEL